MTRILTKTQAKTYLETLPAPTSFLLTAVTSSLDVPPSKVAAKVSDSREKFPMMIDAVTTTTISEPPTRTPRIGEHTEANHDPTATGLFICNIPLLNDPPVVDKVAEVFNNSSRKTLSYIPPESQSGEICYLSFDGRYLWWFTRMEDDDSWLFP
ncbi:UNVERIFIED_CONTAM: hypothetical protein Sradi_2041500 [Sesamum radiatum]|uniref:Uncharacterized protein n=1 Tax=Sesamum radiatum TaxID=300843 RepID=A0AAW2THG9_SESRA